MVNKKKVEEYIPQAIKLIEKEFKDYKDKGLPKELHGYISSFGASIIQSGLIPAVAFYERAETKSNDDIAINRRKLMRIIGNLIGYDLKSKEDNLKNNRDEKDDLLLEKLINGDEAKKKKNDIIHSAIAIKLAIRLYKQFDKGDNNG